MEVGSPEWHRLIIAGGAALGLEVTERHCRRFARHAETLLFWNRKTNLTAIIDPAEIAVKHFVDSIAAARHVSVRDRVLDIGAGGGFPGIPIKVMHPDIHMTLLDKVRKKISFLTHLIATLNLTDTTALHARAEDLHTDPKYAGHFDVVVCRALTTLVDFTRLALPFLKPGGSMLAMRGPMAPEEMAELDDDGLPRLQCQPERYELPMTGDQRTLIRMTVMDSRAQASDLSAGMNL